MVVVLSPTDQWWISTIQLYYGYGIDLAAEYQWDHEEDLVIIKLMFIVCKNHKGYNMIYPNFVVVDSQPYNLLDKDEYSVSRMNKHNINLAILKPN